MDKVQKHNLFNINTPSSDSYKNDTEVTLVVTIIKSAFPCFMAFYVYELDGWREMSCYSCIVNSSHVESGLRIEIIKCIFFIKMFCSLYILNNIDVQRLYCVTVASWNFFLDRRGEAWLVITFRTAVHKLYCWMSIFPWKIRICEPPSKTIFLREVMDRCPLRASVCDDVSSLRWLVRMREVVSQVDILIRNMASVRDMWECVVDL
jgi:hypothetical protein